MANETSALAIRPPVAPNEDSFQTLCAALSASERGRAFLAEYARRNRQADTETLLEAIGRIEARMKADGSAVQRLREDLRLLLIAIRIARPEIDAAAPATRAGKLAKLLDLFESRIDAMTRGTPATAAKPNDSVPAARAHLAVVPPPDESDLPASARAGAPAILLLRDRDKREPAVVQEPAPTQQPAQTNVVPMAEAPPPAPAAASAPPVVADKPAIAPAAPPAVAEKPAIAPALPPADPLAAIMALSEDERLALFT
jgi:hypothetical protein